MFKHQKQNETALLIWTALQDHLSAELKVQTAAQRELSRADAFYWLMNLGHASTKQCCEIQCEAL